MKTKIISFVLLLFIAFPAVSFAQTIPNLPTLQKYVNDFAGILSPSEVAAINNLAAQIEQNSTVQVAVLTINSTQPYDIETYSNQVFRANGIGQQQNNNGLLIVVAVVDRKYRFEVGYGLEGLVPDAKAGDIGRFCFVNNFRMGQYGQGIYCAVQDIGNIVQGQPEVIAQNSNEISFGDIIYLFFTVGVFVLPVFFVLAVFARNVFSPKCPRDGTRMKMQIKDDAVIYECPKCGYKKKEKRKRSSPFIWLLLAGSGGRSSGGGGGGGFGGGSSGGGGASGGW